MKKLLSIAGIVSLVAGALSLMYSALNWYGYYHVLDGSAELYNRLHQRMTVFLIVGIILAIAGGICLFLRCKR